MAEVKSKALINRDSVNKNLFKKFLEPRPITGNNTERSARVKKDLKEFVTLFKKTYGRAPSPLEINNIAKIDRAAVAKYLTKGTDYLSPEETRKITNAEPSLRKTKLDTELSKPVDKLTYTSIDNKKTIIPRFTSKAEEAEYKKLIKESTKTILSLKYYYNRPRPFQLAKFYGITEFENFTLPSMTTPSYPSGHTTQGYLMAELLGREYPKHFENLQKLANMISTSRLMARAHYPSDCKFGKEVGKQIAGKVIQKKND